MRHGYKSLLFALFLGVFLALPFSRIAHAQYVATTTVYVSICGNGIVDPGEVCDDGTDNGQYATSSAGKNCLSGLQRIWSVLRRWDIAGSIWRTMR